jgi:phosphate-selective porin OprO/OprP
MEYRRTALALALLVAVSQPGIWAQQLQTDDRQAMEQEILELRKRIDELDQRLRASDRKQELKAADDEAKAKTAPAVAADTTGFTIKSGDGNFLLKIGADLQVDNRTFTGGGSTSLTDQILLRRVRPTFSGTVYKYVDYFFRPDFGLGTTVIYDAYIQLNYFPHINLRVGKFKPPVGLERLQSDDDTSFIERGLPTLLVPSRDIGYQIGGDMLNRRVGYQVGVFNGVVDNSLSDAAVSNHRDYAGRIFLTPFAPSETSPLKGLGFGIGATGGNVDGLGLPAYKTVGQNTFFSFASGVAEAGHRTRLTPQATYYVGPFGLLAEYGLSEEGLQKGTVRRDVAFRAWQTEVSYILTGEAKGFTSPTPRHSFDPMHNGWGAIELAARTGEFSADHTIFSYGFAAPNATPRSAREYVGGVNWYLNRLVRISADYAVTGFEGGAIGGNRIAERVILFRFQINFI